MFDRRVITKGELRELGEKVGIETSKMIRDKILALPTHAIQEVPEAPLITTYIKLEDIINFFVKELGLEK